MKQVRSRFTGLAKEMDSTSPTSLIDNFPFKVQLGSNYVPTDPEIQEIKAFLLHPIERIRSIEHELTDLKTRLKALRKEHKSLIRQVEICQTIITLPRRLPDDILSEIFYQSLPTTHNAAMSKSVPPLIFTQICKHWREVALSTPRLWSTIHIHVVQKDRDQSGDDFDDDVVSSITPGKWDKKRATDAVEWLRRSGQRPLSISVVGNDIWAAPSRAFYDLQLSSIIPFAARWRNLFFGGPPGSFSSLAAIKAVDLPCLNSLFLDFRPAVQGHLQNTWKNCGLLTAPSLRKLSLQQNHMDITALNINWSQLTHLDLGTPPQRHSPLSPSIAVASEVLRFCERLVYCKIDLADADHNHAIMRMPLPLLQKLSIRTNENIARFIENLDAPELSCVDLEFLEHSKPFISILLRKRTIRKLDITTCYLLHSSFLDSLRQCHTLVSLTIKHYFGVSLRDSEGTKTPFTLDDKFLGLLTDDNDPLCPRLEELIYESTIGFSMFGMREFIRRKQDGLIPGLAKLKTIFISNVPYRKQGNRVLKALAAWKNSEEVRHYIADGLEIQNCRPDVFDWEIEEDDDEDDLPISFGNSGAQYSDSWLE